VPGTRARDGSEPGSLAGAAAPGWRTGSHSASDRGRRASDDWSSMMEALMQVRVTARWELAEGTAGYELAATDGGALPPFEAGSHIDVHLPGGLIRQYSLHDLPSDPSRYRIGVLREPQSRGGSAA